VRIYPDNSSDFRTDNSLNDLYDVFLISYTVEKTTWHLDKATTYNFIPCSDVVDVTFMEHVNIQHGLDNYLCPESGDIYFNGVNGTHLWVVPKSDSDEYNIT
jgi:hypothetical protein